MLAYKRTPAPPVRECRPEVPEELAAIVHRLLAKDPKDRYASADELATALQPFSTGADLRKLVSTERADADKDGINTAGDLCPTETFLPPAQPQAGPIELEVRPQRIATAEAMA